MDGLSDAQLVKKFISGSDEALEDLISRYLKSVYNFLFQLTGDQSVLDDLTQETFVKVWKNIKKFDPEKSFKSWIFAIAKNTAYDYLKKKKSVPFSMFLHEDGSNKLEEIADGQVLPDELLVQADAAKKLEEKLKEIPQQYQLILSLHYKEDLTLQEISKVLGIPYNTIKSQHQRALLALRKNWPE